MPRTQIKGPDIESTSLESKISNDIDFTKVETERINLTSVNPTDTATFFGTDDSGNSTLHMRIGNGSGDKIQIESWNGSAATSLMEVGQTTVTIKGNLVVSGTTTTVNSETLEVGDNFIILNSGVTGSPTLDAGIKVERGSEADVEFKWNETEDKWETDSGLIVGGNIRTAVGSGLSDADEDTYITVEKTANENMIHFYTGGSEKISIGDYGLRIYSNITTKAKGLELTSLNSGDRDSYIDFHSDDTNTDYSARIRRYPGVNGNLEIKNVGTGEIHFITNGGERVIIDSVGQLHIKNDVKVYGDIKRDETSDKYIFIPEQTNDNDFIDVVQLKLGPYLTLGNLGQGNYDFISSNAILDYSSFGGVGSEGDGNKFIPHYKDGKGFVINLTHSGECNVYGIDWNGSSARKELSDFTPITMLQHNGIVKTPSNVYMEYYSNVSQTFAAGTTTTGVRFPVKITDTHNIYNTSTGVITIPADGFYLISAQILVNDDTKSGHFVVEIYDAAYNHDDQWHATQSSQYSSKWKEFCVNAIMMKYLEKDTQIKVAVFSAAEASMYVSTDWAQARNKLFLAKIG